MEDDSSAMSSWFNIRSWLKWRPTSGHQLEESEKKILSHVKVNLDNKYVTISNGYKRIWTVVAKNDKSSVPLVMVHGFGGGTALWAQNIDHISQKSSVYMMDVLGFGKSSRPQFSHDPDTAELEFVDSLEEWRAEMKLDKFVLLGHSLGAFIVSSYALRYPDNVKHLILVDPWGYSEKPPERVRTLPLWIRAIMTVVKPFNPLAIIRAAGPWGPGLVKRFRGDLGKKFSSMLNEDLVLDYVYHCNAQNPSGEAAFKSLTQSLGWARNPMISRVADIRSDLPITMIYGSRSWLSADTGYDVKYRRADSYVDVQVVKGAGHHVYADKPENFNAIVGTICESVNKELIPSYVTDAGTSRRDSERKLSESSDTVEVMVALNMDDGGDLMETTTT